MHTNFSKYVYRGFGVPTCLWATVLILSGARQPSLAWTMWGPSFGVGWRAGLVDLAWGGGAALCDCSFSLWFVACLLSMHVVHFIVLDDGIMDGGSGLMDELGRCLAGL